MIPLRERKGHNGLNVPLLAVSFVQAKDPQEAASHCDRLNPLLHSNQEANIEPVSGKKHQVQNELQRNMTSKEDWPKNEEAFTGMAARCLPHPVQCAEPEVKATMLISWIAGLLIIMILLGALIIQHRLQMASEEKLTKDMQKKMKEHAQVLKDKDEAHRREMELAKNEATQRQEQLEKELRVQRGRFQNEIDCYKGELMQRNLNAGDGPTAFNQLISQFEQQCPQMVDLARYLYYCVNAQYRIVKMASNFVIRVITKIYRSICQYLPDCVTNILDKILEMLFAFAMTGIVRGLELLAALVKLAYDNKNWMLPPLLYLFGNYLVSCIHRFFLVFAPYVTFAVGPLMHVCNIVVLPCASKVLGLVIPTETLGRMTQWFGTLLSYIPFINTNWATTTTLTVEEATRSAQEFVAGVEPLYPEIFANATANATAAAAALATTAANVTTTAVPTAAVATADVLTLGTTLTGTCPAVGNVTLPAVGNVTAVGFSALSLNA